MQGLVLAESGCISSCLLGHVSVEGLDFSTFGGLLGCRQLAVPSPYHQRHFMFFTSTCHVYSYIAGQALAQSILVLVSAPGP